ncbi:unnamed protein product [Larinioides sclopetarius]
MCCL